MRRDVGALLSDIVRRYTTRACVCVEWCALQRFVISCRQTKMGQRKTTEESGINRHRFVAHARGVVRGRSRTRVEWCAAARARAWNGSALKRFLTRGMLPPRDRVWLVRRDG